jgi:N-acetylglutamate synthase
MKCVPATGISVHSGSLFFYKIDYTNSMYIRPITFKDYDNLLPLWQENYFANEMDEYPQFELFLSKNPGLSLLAEEDGKIIGSILGSYDGRRGYIQKLVIDKTYRRKGIGKQLMLALIEKLHETGVLYIPLAVEPELLPFYLSCGFKQTTQIPMNMSWSTFNYKK